MPSYPSNQSMRSGIQSQLEFMHSVTRHSFDSMLRLSQLNTDFLQQLMQDTTDASRRLMRCSDFFELAATGAAAAQPAVEHMRRYQEQVAELASGGQPGFGIGAIH